MRKTDVVPVCRVKVRPRTPAEIQALFASALQPLAIALASLVPVEADEPPEEWIPHDRSPLGRRKTRELATGGAFPGARKVGKKWLIPRAVLNAYVEREGASSANGNAEDGTSADVADLASELGYSLTPPKPRRGEP